MNLDKGERIPRLSTAPSYTSRTPSPGRAGATPQRQARTTSDLVRRPHTSSRVSGAVSVGVNGPEGKSPPSPLIVGGPSNVRPTSSCMKDESLDARSGPFCAMLRATSAAADAGTATPTRVRSPALAQVPPSHERAGVTARGIVSAASAALHSTRRMQQRIASLWWKGPGCAGQRLSREAKSQEPRRRARLDHSRNAISRDLGALG